MKHDESMAILSGWLVLVNLLVFFLFRIDKWRAKRASLRRISERFLLSLCALGGWPGGLLGILLFRHKSGKLSFLLQFFAASVLSVLLLSAALKLTGQL